MKAIALIIAVIFAHSTSAMIINNEKAEELPYIGKADYNFNSNSDLLTPEALWAMGRIGGVVTSPDDQTIVYEVAYYSVKYNMSHIVLYAYDVKNKTSKLLTTDAINERAPMFVARSSRIAYMSNKSGSYQVWTMNVDGENK